MLKDPTEVKVIVDNRELKGRVVEELFRIKAQLDVRTLAVADYVVSDRVGIEFKTVKDFEASIIDGRLFKQCEELVDNFDNPIIIVQGDCLFHGRVHPNAVRGAIASITTDYNIPIITVDTPQEAAQLIIAYARREQSELSRQIKYNASRKSFTDKQFQESIIAAFPKIGGKLAAELLNYFGSVKRVINASLEELNKVPGIAKGKATIIYSLTNKEYKD
ncbi:MAG: ERCC4 domain-containing protein [Candidatus Nanoarchaeia archaeon]|jgi:Fanconi anemia group M protein